MPSDSEASEASVPSAVVSKPKGRTSSRLEQLEAEVRVLAARVATLTKIVDAHPESLP